MVILDYPSRALIIAIVWMIGDYKIGCFSVHAHGMRFGLGAVAADQTVVPQQPQIAGRGDRGFLQFGIYIEIVIVGVFHAAHEFVHLSVVETQQGQVDGVGLQVEQFHGKHFIVPPGIERQTVIRKDVGTFLRVGQVLDDNAGHRFNTLSTGGFQPAMANKQVVLVVNNERRDYTKRPNDCPNLRNLFFAVCTSVSYLGNEPTDWNHFRPLDDLHVHPPSIPSLDLSVQNLHVTKERHGHMPQPFPMLYDNSQGKLSFQRSIGYQLEID